MANYRHKIDKSERSLEIILRFSFSKRVGKKKDISKKKKKYIFRISPFSYSWLLFDRPKMN